MMKRKNVLRIKVRDAGEVMDYEAVARRSNGETLKIRGFTYCETKECITQILKRALTGRRDPPEDVEKAVAHVVGYLYTSIKSLGAGHVSAGLALSVGVDTELALGLTVYRLDGGEEDDEEGYVGWYAEVRTAFSGYDGAAAVDGFHEFKKELKLGEYLDDSAVRRLIKELKDMAKLAYNISPTG